MEIKILMIDGRWKLNGKAYHETFGTQRLVFEEFIRQRKSELVGKMKKEDQVKFWNAQIEAAKNLKSIARQEYQIAARMESEAKSALELLGTPSGRSRKGQLSDRVKTQLIAALTPELKA